MKFLAADRRPAPEPPPNTITTTPGKPPECRPGRSRSHDTRPSRPTFAVVGFDDSPYDVVRD